MTTSGPEVCRCGHPRHPNDPNRCEKGHPWRGGAGPALLVGKYSPLFWREHAATYATVTDAVIRDAGFTPEEAPEALRLAAVSIAQSAIVRDAAYTRMAEGGGPLSPSNMPRRAFRVWLEAVRALEAHLRLVGLKRTPKTAQTLADYLERRARAVAQAQAARRDDADAGADEGTATDVLDVEPGAPSEDEDA